jgi:hypothetical protein
VRDPQKSIEAGVGHFEHASDIGGLGAIEKHTGIEGIGIDAVFGFQELQRHESIEEIAGGALMQSESISQCCEIRRRLCQGTEDAEFDGT